MRTMIAIPLLCLALLCLALNAVAECPVQHPRVQPEIPNAAIASPQEMRRAQFRGEQYLLQGKTYLDCGYMNRRQYNDLVGQLEVFAEKFNEELIEYQSRTQMVADIEQMQALSVSGLSAR
jgi:hypothetical protein